MTTPSSTHELQMNVRTGEWRHRVFSINRYAKSRVFPPDNFGITDWVPGHPQPLEARRFAAYRAMQQEED